MRETLFRLYRADAEVLINREIESAYWQEWELFRLPGGITGFLIIHFPVLFVMRYSLTLLKDGGTAENEEAYPFYRRYGFYPAHTTLKLVE